MCSTVKKNANKPQCQPQGCSMPSSGCTQGPADHPQYNVQTFPIPAPMTDYDFDHRRTITIESQQCLWPQDIWVHSPHGRQLYQPVLMFPTTPPENQPETNGEASKSG
ncbi:hypothetical protein FGADI_7792 [Fusarium gaditjirri]|uniref:Uncharacterized protein n=1 Tax=Fusarium gaditjirri TaxID=282569 RepID=A0A8H4T4A5_9HYPO|nr:hypothetical protein FGADI_7792 [Fusarium gaditjirri]